MITPRILISRNRPRQSPPRGAVILAAAARSALLGWAAFLFAACGSSAPEPGQTALPSTVAVQPNPADTAFLNSWQAADAVEYLRLGRQNLKDSLWFEASDRLDSALAHFTLLAASDSLEPGLQETARRYVDTAQELLASAIAAGATLGGPEGVSEFMNEEMGEVSDSANHHLDSLLHHLPDTRFDLPLPNPLPERVIKAMGVFTGSGRGYFTRWLERRSRYEALIRQQLTDRGMPQDLLYLAMVESGFNPHAWSRAKASGMWQFISGTGRRYGLKDDWWVDPRRDIVQSTKAALDYLEDLYAEFQDWHLAMAAYNCGEGRIRRKLAAADSGAKPTYWEMDLPAETEYYVPKILAAMIIGHNPEAFEFTNLNPQAPLTFDTVSVEHCLSLKAIAGAIGATEDTLQFLNPSIRRWCTHPSRFPFRLYLPEGTRDQFLAAYAAMDKEALTGWKRHVVRSGETLSGIASRYGVPMGAIKSANDMRGTRIWARQALVIPVPAYAGEDRVGADGDEEEQESAPKKKSAAVAGRYKVSRGETLYDIARRFRVSVAALRDANGMTPRSVLKAGQNLKIPGNADWDHGTATASEGNSATPAKAVGGEHRVQRGESIYSIANKYGISQERLMAVNGLSSSGIRAGQTLKLPGSESAPSTPSTASSATESKPAPAAAPAPTGKTHRVARGESIYTIALHYGISQADLMAANGLTDADIQAGQELRLPSGAATASEPTAGNDQLDVPRAAASTARATEKTHKVSAGESYYSIAQRYGTDVPTLLALNEKTDGTTLFPGDELTLPSPTGTAMGARRQEKPQQFYRVKTGDTLWDISVRFNATVAQLKELNDGLTSSLRPGQTIRIR